MITITDAWQILGCSNREYIHLQHVDHPGYITIKAGDKGFILDVWPDVGNESESSTYAFYDDLREDGPKI